MKELSNEELIEMCQYVIVHDIDMQKHVDELITRYRTTLSENAKLREELTRVDEVIKAHNIY